MGRKFSAASRDAWQGLNLEAPKRRLRARFDQADYDSLKQAYVEKYGYNITIPEWSDIIRLKPNLLKTPEEIKAEKRHNLQRILASPAPEFYNKYASLMTLIDNLQDTSSTVFPALRMLTRWSPQMVGKLIPYFGWALLAYDALQLANVFGRAPWKVAMRSKRASCELLKSNPFTKKAQFNRMDRIAKWDPSVADLLQVLQTTSDVTGTGLSFGPIIGFVADMASGLVRAAMGQRVTFGHELPPFNPVELKSAAGLKAAALINTTGQVFDEEIHFWAYATFAASTYFLSPWIEQADVAGACENPLDAIVPAPEPEDPLTREVITEAGLSISNGIGWPHIGDKQAPMRDVQRLVMDKGQTSFYDYSLRHSNDSYGMLAASFMYDSIIDLNSALEPGAEIVEEDAPHAHVFFNMLKAPLLPDQDISKEQGKAFGDWVNAYAEHFGHVPPIKEVKLHLDVMGIKWKTTYPATMDPNYAKYWPEPFDDSSLL